MAFTGKYEFEGDENYDDFVTKIGEYVVGVSLKGYKSVKKSFFFSFLKCFLLKCAEIHRG